MKTYSLLAAAILFALASASPSSAQLLFQDTFDRLDSRNIDAELTGVTDNTGSSLAIDGVYVQPFLDPNNADPTNGAPDGVAGNGGGAQILGNLLELADSSGTSNAYVNHNFINNEILTQGGFSVEVSIDSLTQTSSGQGGGFGIGMSQAQADATLDALNAPSKFQDGFTGGTNSATSLAVSDFWVVLRGNSTLAWGGFGNSLTNAAEDNALFGTASVAANTGTIRADFDVTDFNDGSQVLYELYYDNVLQDSGAFTWTGSDQNFIGLDARDSQGVFFDDFSVTAAAIEIEPPAVPTVTIDRDTGAITLENRSDDPIEIVGYTIQTTNGGFDTAAWSRVDGQVPETWLQFTEAINPSTDLSEGTLGVTGLTLAAFDELGSTDELALGNAWIQSPFETISAEVVDVNGQTIEVDVEFTGNGDAPFILGDFNLDNALDAADWAILRSNLISTPADSGLLSYGMGNINSDAEIDGLDFDEFKAQFNAVNGAGAFAAMVAAVPEPASLALFAIAGALSVVRRSRCVLGVSALVLFLSAGVTPASAQVLFQDTFDRNDSRNIDAELIGITDNTGSSLAINGVYTHGFVDPANDDPTNGAPDTAASNGGGAQIISGELELADINGTSNAFINHNFINNDILTQGGFSVTLDLNGVNQSSAGQGGGFAIGMSLAQATDTGDASSGNGSTTGNFMMTDGFTNTSGDSNMASDVAVSDFWAVLRGDGSLIWGGLGNAITGAANDGPAFFGTTNVGANTGTLRAEFGDFSDFNDGTSVGYQLFYNDSLQAAGSFNWSGTGENYIGLDARDNQGVFFDNLSVVAEEVTIGPPPVLTLSLEVNTQTGEVFLLGGPTDQTIDRYTVASAGGLLFNNFDGIGGDEGLPVGEDDLDPEGWQLGGVQTETLLNEFFLGAAGDGGSTIVGESGFRASLGLIYDTVLDSQDLVLEYRLTDGTLVSVADAAYVTSPPGADGDFDGDGFVTAADYAIWRAGASPNSLSLGDYDNWAQDFGSGAGSVVSSANVPEPATVALWGLAVAMLPLRRVGRG